MTKTKYLVEEDKLWVDVAKGAVVSGTFCILLGSLFLTILGGGMVWVLVLFGLIILESLVLYWFVFRGDGKHIEVHWPYFFAGLLSGFIIVVFFFTFLAALVGQS